LIWTLNSGVDDSAGILNLENRKPGIQKLTSSVVALE
jgi:hypothetical protein